MKTLLSLWILLTIFPSCSLEKEKKTPPPPGKKTISVHGHRGARLRYPENTLPALKHALESGADVLEFDLGISKDGVVVLNHNVDIDPNVCLDSEDKKFNAKKLPLVKELTLKELKEFDCGSLVHPRFPEQKIVPGTRIPTLEEVFTWIKHSPLPNAQSVHFNIETKIEPSRPYATLPPREFVEKTLAVIERFGLSQRVIIQSFDFRSLVEVQKLNPKIRTSALTERNENLIEVAKKYKVDFVSPNYQQIKKEDVEKLHAMNVKVAPWTANDKAAWDLLIKMGVDAIITDDPKSLIDYLGLGR